MNSPDSPASGNAPEARPTNSETGKAEIAERIAAHLTSARHHLNAALQRLRQVAPSETSLRLHVFDSGSSFFGSTHSSACCEDVAQLLLEVSPPKRRQALQETIAQAQEELAKLPADE